MESICVNSMTENKCDYAVGRGKPPRREKGRRRTAAPARPVQTPADEEVMAIFIARLRQSWEEELR
jgi:hypothetical protein